MVTNVHPFLPQIPYNGYMRTHVFTHHCLLTNSVAIVIDDIDDTKD